MKNKKCYKSGLLKMGICTALFLSAGTFLLAQDPGGETGNVEEFKVISRIPVANGERSRIGSDASYEIKAQENGKAQYQIIRTERGNVSVDALSHIAYSKNADRIITYGDSLNRHMVTKVYLKVYSGSGTLIKSTPLIASWPFVAKLAEDGSFIIAGNKNSSGTANMALTKFDKNGNKVWEQPLSGQIPTKLYVSEKADKIAVVFYDEVNLKSNIYYFNGSGSKLTQDLSHLSVSGIEFLPNERVVVAGGDKYSIYDFKQGYKRIVTVGLKGSTIGEYPIAAHRSGNWFSVVTIGSSGGQTAYRVQAFDSTGRLLAESEFEGNPYWEPGRMLDITPEGNIQLVSDKEIITLSIGKN